MSSSAAPMLTAGEAGRVLGLSARTMYALAAAGKIASHRMGLGDGAVRFDPADIEAYKHSCRSPATTRAAGSTSLIASSPDGEHALTDYFRKAGRALTPKPSISEKPPASTRLRLVADRQNP